MTKFLVFFIATFFIAVHISAQETRINIRAKAKDAKFIGSSLGGAHIIVRNKVNGQILAEGKTEGSTGDTKLIMDQLLQRGESIATPETAKFQAVLDIDEPTFVEIEVLSPINLKTSQVRATTELWVIPGKHILNDGIVLEIPGLIIDVLEPRTHAYISLNSLASQSLPIQVNVVMMCGCSVESGGLWDADKMEIKAMVKHNGKRMDDVTLKFASRNLFEGRIPVTDTGNYEVIVYGYEEHTGNTGLDKVNYVILD
ncbi:hypothetical protein [Sphingobacterium gobiense]|uniref:Uncharacterized protein n=1 Tax=Sphingobacterium gobiense TaxID=1382456 RepID=A0A2S9JL41_9SPHI|nr:hypothetical protein [Sphingobacterium gobiense]PRD53870.1 hypothetical protein C5749_10145 [Sphingobacterium gobiense]